MITGLFYPPGPHFCCSVSVTKNKLRNCPCPLSSTSSVYLVSVRKCKWPGFPCVSLLLYCHPNFLLAHNKAARYRNHTMTGEEEWNRIRGPCCELLKPNPNPGVEQQNGTRDQMTMAIILWPGKLRKRATNDNILVLSTLR